MNTDKMSKKECLAYIKEATNRYNRYLSEESENPFAAKYNTQAAFATFIPDSLVTKYTRKQLLSDIYEDIMNVSRYYMGGNPEIKQRGKKYADDCIASTDKVDEIENRLRETINGKLQENGINLVVQCFTDDEIRLAMDDREWTYIELYKYQDHPAVFDVRGLTNINLGKADACERMASFYSSIAKFISTPSLQNEIFRVWKEGLNEQDKIEAAKKKIDEQYKEDICKIVYRHLRVFAKGILDLELPETLE